MISDSDFEHSSTLQEDDPEQPKKVIKLARFFTNTGETILDIAKNRWLVYSDANLLDLAEDLAKFPAIPAVAVLSELGKTQGLIIKSELFDLLSRPFGRDVLRKEPVSNAALAMKAFNSEATIHAVSEEISKLSGTDVISYFPVETNDGEFAGIFSTHDLFVHLTNMIRYDVATTRGLHSRMVKDLTLIEDTKFSIIASATQSRGINNSFYHIKKTEGGRWSLSLMSIPKKGISTALVAAALWGKISSFPTCPNLYAYVRTLNHFVISMFEHQKTISGLFMEYEPDSATLFTVDMGLNNGYIFRNQKLMRMKTGTKTLPLGATQDPVPEIFRYKLEKNDVLVIFNDCINHLVNKAGIPYSMQRIKDILIKRDKDSLSQLRNLIIEDITRYCGSSIPASDVTFYLLKNTKSE